MKVAVAYQDDTEQTASLVTFGALQPSAPMTAHIAQIEVENGILFGPSSTIRTTATEWLGTAAFTLRLHREYEMTLASEAASLLVREHFASIPEVRSARLVRDGDALRFMTILDGNPFDRSVRYQIFDIEREVSGALPDLPIEFELVNLAEYPAERRDELADQPGEEIYHRTS